MEVKAVSENVIPVEWIGSAWKVRTEVHPPVAAVRSGWQRRPSRHIDRPLPRRLRVMSAVFAMFATRPVYLRVRKDCGIAANRL